MRAFVLGTGESMNQAVADSVRGRGVVYAVSDAFRLAPWADALVSTDAMWWYTNEDARAFAGRKFAGVDVAHILPDVFQVGGGVSGTNSGLLALHVAVLEGAREVALLGIDMQGSHFFGEHPTPLCNTTEARFADMMRQFCDYRPDDVSIVNCSPASRLDCYPRVPLEDML